MTTAAPTRVQLHRDAFSAMTAAVEAQRQSRRNLALALSRKAVCTYDSEGVAA